MRVSRGREYLSSVAFGSVDLFSILGFESAEYMPVGGFGDNALLGTVAIFFIENGAHRLDLLVYHFIVLYWIFLHPQSLFFFDAFLLGRLCRLDEGQRLMSGRLTQVIVQPFTLIEDCISLMDLHEFDEFIDGLGCLRFKVLVVFHGFELMVYLEDEGDELVLICFFVFVELDDPSLKDVEEGVNTLIVALFLGPGCKARVY